jgi:hypothetical protein
MRENSFMKKIEITRNWDKRVEIINMSKKGV